MNYQISNLERLLDMMSIAPESEIEKVEKNILKLGYKNIEEAYDDLLENIHDLSLIKSFVKSGLLKIDPVTPLFHALLSNELESGKYLIKKGADVNKTIEELGKHLSNDEIREILYSLSI